MRYGLALFGAWLILGIPVGLAVQFAEDAVKTAVKVAYQCKDRGRSEDQCRQDVRAAITP